MQIFMPPDPEAQPNAQTFFAAVPALLDTLDAKGVPLRPEDVLVHVDYLAEKAGCDRDAVFSGMDLAVDEGFVHDALLNIAAVLRIASTASASPLPDPLVEGLPSAVFGAIQQAEARLHGWCSREKALAIAKIVLEHKPRICVEIGIFGGRSLVPCAAALKHNGLGEIYGIESWSNAAAVEVATNDANDAWWSSIDFHAIKRDFYRFLLDLDLMKQVRIIETTSARAGGVADVIDYLHIDGSHSIINAAEDVLLFGQKVRSGGHIIFDDINWASTRPARDILEFLCEPVLTLKDPETGQDLCAILRRK